MHSGGEILNKKYDLTYLEALVMGKVIHQSLKPMHLTQFLFHIVKGSQNNVMTPFDQADCGQ